MRTYVIALDQGTTSSRAVIFDDQARIVAMKSYEFEQIYPQPGWVEHDPAAILNTQVDSLREVVRISGIPVEEIDIFFSVADRITKNLELGMGE